MNRFVTCLAASLALVTPLLHAQGSITKSPGNLGTVDHTFAKGGAQGHTSFEFFLTPRADPGLGSAYFWAYQFQFNSNQAGYMGLQTNGGVTTNSQEGRKVAIASVWSAVGATAAAGSGSSCFAFAHEDSGFTCRLAYDWQVGLRYRLRFALLNRTDRFNNQDVTSWRFLVRDESTQREIVVGTFYVPRTWQLMDNAAAWTEYFTTQFNGTALLADCSNLPFSSIAFSATADGSLQPLSATTSRGNGICSNITVANGSMTGGTQGTQISGIGGLCLGSGGSAVNGSPIALAKCANPASLDQQWRFVNGNLVGLQGKCATNVNASFNNGTRLVLWDCVQAQHQRFEVFGRQIRSTGSTRCLTTLNQASTAGTQIVLWDCLDATNQRWTVSR